MKIMQFVYKIIGALLGVLIVYLIGDLWLDLPKLVISFGYFASFIVGYHLMEKYLEGLKNHNNDN